MRARLDIARQVLELVDPALRPALSARFEAGVGRWAQSLPAAAPVVLVGHRAAGKSTLLPLVARLLGRPAVDLDEALGRRRPLREWFRADEAGFRRAEREAFAALPPGCAVAVGGGFLSLHADLLRAAVPVLVPVCFQTHAQRLADDLSRPRLRPELTLDEELRVTWAEREVRHASVATVDLVDFLLRALAGRRPRRVVTLAPGADPGAFALRARTAGAELLEVRSDLTSPLVDLRAASATLPLLLAQRGEPLPDAWRALATLEDSSAGAVRSFHSDAPLRPAEVLSQWAGLPEGVLLKHVEPVGPLAEAPRLFETQRLLVEAFGPERVTVLPTGPLALPFRAVLAQRNALDFCALDGAWSAARGQRLVADAAREWRGPIAALRLGIVGSSLEHSRSPSIHTQPFDRVDLTPDAPVGELLAALRPHYRGFSVTSPFKKRVGPATLNSLRRSDEGWEGANTDVEGAKAVLRAVLGLERAGGRGTIATGAGAARVEVFGRPVIARSPGPTEATSSGVTGSDRPELPTPRFAGGPGSDGIEGVTVLGDGGAAEALRLAARQLGVRLTVRPRRQAGALVTGPVVWTWPPQVEAPAGLSLRGARVAVIAYGGPGRAVAERIRRLGGAPLRLGARWFVAQARAQRDFFQGVTT